jgi:dihydrodipicolinate synthase/N-acetylneuraminate lyase
MKPERVKELFVGPVATVPTPFDDEFEVDHGRMAELTKWWVANGLVKGKAVIKVAAAMGEGPMLRDDELHALLRTTVQAADDKAAIVLGLGYKDTKRTIEDAKRAQDLGAIALQVVPPIFNLPTQDDLLRFFGDLSDAIEIGIMVYVTKSMYTPIYMDTYRKMADFENVVAIKWGAVVGEYEDIFEMSDRFNIVDNSKGPVACHRLGGKGYITTTADIHPPHELRVWELCENGQYDEAHALYQSVEKPLGKLFGKLSERTGGQGVGKKGMMAAMGRPVGASRPPSGAMNEEEMAELRETMKGFGWPVP